MRRAPLLRLDPELAGSLDDAQRQRAERTLLVPVIPVPPGAWQAPATAPRGADLGLLIVEGQLVRELVIEGAHGVELLGEGDLIRPWQEDASSFCAASWRALGPVRLAVLDEGLVRRLCEWPELVVALTERVMRRARSMAHAAAVSNLVGIDRRVHALLWQLAEKWGRVENGGVVVTVRLTHQLLAEMVGARRPSVTQALGRLTEAGEIEQRSDSCWALKTEPPATVASRRPAG